MKRIIFILLAAITGIQAVMADGNWKMHPTFDEEVSHVIETPGYVYFTSRNMAINDYNNTYFALFRYDKSGEEIISLSTDNLLSGNLVNDVIYNPKKGYLAVLLNDGKIDLLHNNGNVTRIPYYEMASMSFSKAVNGLSIDPDNDRLYLATDFGYVSVNDKKGEIAESRIYDEPLKSFVRLGDNYIVIHDNQLKKAAVKDNRFNIEDYSVMELVNDPVSYDDMSLEGLYPLSDKYLVLKYYNGLRNKLKIISIEGDNANVIRDLSGPVYNVEYNSNGVVASTDSKLYQINWDSSFSQLSKPDGYVDSAAGSDNMSDLWVGFKRKGLAGLRFSNDEWKLVKNFMMPNAPAVFYSSSYAQHPDKGLLVLNHGMNPVTVTLFQGIPMQLSGHKNNLWTNYSPSYLEPELSDISLMPNGIAVDPDNPSLVYISSPHHGILRWNLNNPDDKIMLSRPNERFAAYDWFYPLVPRNSTLPQFANFSHPYFDAKGNLWMAYSDYDKADNYKPQLYCWTAEDRRATTSASNIKPPKYLEVNQNVSVSNIPILRPLLKTGNGLLVFTPSTYDDELLLINTNGTPVDPSDDNVYNFTEYIDGDGNNIEIRQIKYIYEDPSTGYVWVAHLNGVCYFIPSQVLNYKNYQMNRVKVARNDGTNLADYLLEGVRVNWIASDNQGRKWFATHGGGLLCTSSDGREIIMEFTSSNSDLPDDVVYSIAYDSEANSMMISTAGGLAEYFLPVSQYSTEKEDVKAYPNPVRPDYTGYVTICDIPEGSLVKIVDSGGNLVKELGIVSGFDILWDISDTNFNRVSSGVYYILVSPSNESGSYSTVGKILVIS
ncbi:MAG: hypothetical protein J1E82_02515 [Muribaculaceae bacterium]|nr:hypothetical protein [Muribaculaceae bacterium]